MNKLKFLFRIGFAWMVFAIATASTASAQCNLSASADGCVGVPQSFKLAGPDVNGADSVVWAFSNGKAFGASVSNLWTGPANGPNANYTVKVYKNGSEICNVPGTITIHANPIADFVSLSPTPQCFNGNLFNFQDNSTTPSGNPIVSREFVYGDGGKRLDNTQTGIPKNIGPYTYTPPNPNGGFFTPSLKIIDSKGCEAFVDKTALIEIQKDLGVDFYSPEPTGCIKTPVELINQSAIALADVKTFKWTFGDTSKSSNTTNWDTAKYVYTDDGCFNATLFVEALTGCVDSAVKLSACNVNPKLNVSVANGDVQCFNNQSFQFNHPVIQNAQSLKWTFDDPPSGQLNEDRQAWNPTHDFTSMGPFDVKFQVTIAGCDFDTIYRVHVKGPVATIESKPSPIIPPSQRYQCKITDTVYFPNVSKYYFNDDSAYNDFFYELDTSKAIFQFINKDSAHIDFDTIQLGLGPRSFVTQTGKNVYQNGDTIIVETDTLKLKGAFLVGGEAENSMIDANNNPGKHVDRIWDFADRVAKQCTTDSRPIYPKLAKYNNLHFPGTLAPANTYDANGKWINCNFSRDSLPKHWYTPGEEDCYIVRLTLKDTSSPDPNIENSTASKFDPSFSNIGGACESIAQVPLALQGPDASRLKIEGDPCYGNPNVYGYVFKFDETKPSCDRQQFWIHLDSLADRVDLTPNTFDKWIPQTGTVVDRNFTPWTIATQGLPPNVGEIFWQYRTQGSYPAKIADPRGFVTIGFRVQSGIDPITGQPCIDEKWYHHPFRYINSNSGYKFNSDLNNPNNTYTLEKLCPPNESIVKRDSTFYPAINNYDYVIDSIGVENWNWGDGEVEVDSFFRYQCDGNLCYSYRIRYLLVGTDAPVKIDSVVTRIYDPIAQKTVFVSEKDSIPDIKRKHRFLIPGRLIVSHDIYTCQMLPRTVLGVTEYFKSCCPGEITRRVVVSGFFTAFNVSDSVVCRNVPIQFFDSARYYVEQERLTPPLYNDPYDFWDKVKQRFNNDGITPRPKPTPLPQDYEKLAYNFDDGSGWNNSVPDNPVRSFPEPGIYEVKIEYTDSLACKIKDERRIKVTGVSANFTFNRGITQCRPTVDFSDTTLMIDPCTLLTPSTNCDNVVKWEWDFGDNKPNNQSQSILQNPSKIYTSFGDFDVLLKVTTQLGCVDTIIRTISLEGPRPKFEFAADSVGCVPFTVELRNTSINPTNASRWTYYWGDGKFITDTLGGNITHTYDTAGEFEIIVLQEDYSPLSKSICSAIFPDTNFTNQQYRKYIVRVLPSRKADFSIADSILCVRDSTRFTSTGDTIYDTFRWVWGDGSETNLNKAGGGASVSHQFNTPGTFYVQFRPNYTPPPGEPTCRTSMVKRVFVRDVKAILDCSDTINKPNIFFQNNSTNAQDVFWDFGVGQGYVDGKTLPDFPNARYNYGNNQGNYTVKLLVRSPEGCLDSTDCGFPYTFNILINPPNAFSPGDKDNLNDFFDVLVENEEAYELSIFNRWGERVFFADNKDALWDGKHMSSGADCPEGVYFVVINYRLRGQEDKIYRGSLTLFRKK